MAVFYAFCYDGDLGTIDVPDVGDGTEAEDAYDQALAKWGPCNYAGISTLRVQHEDAEPPDPATMGEPPISAAERYTLDWEQKRRLNSPRGGRE